MHTAKRAGVPLPVAPGAATERDWVNQRDPSSSSTSSATTSPGRAKASCTPHSGQRASPSTSGDWLAPRSEEHTSELQSLMRISYAVFCLKKKKNNNYAYT